MHNLYFFDYVIIVEINKDLHLLFLSSTSHSIILFKCWRSCSIVLALLIFNIFSKLLLSSTFWNTSQLVGCSIQFKTVWTQLVRFFFYFFNFQFSFPWKYRYIAVHTYVFSIFGSFSVLNLFNTVFLFYFIYYLSYASSIIRYYTYNLFNYVITEGYLIWYHSISTTNKKFGFNFVCIHFELDFHYFVHCLHLFCRSFSIFSITLIFVPYIFPLIGFLRLFYECKLIVCYSEPSHPSRFFLIFTSTWLFPNHITSTHVQTNDFYTFKRFYYGEITIWHAVHVIYGNIWRIRYIYINIYVYRCGNNIMTFTNERFSHRFSTTSMLFDHSYYLVVLPTPQRNMLDEDTATTKYRVCVPKSNEDC